MPDVNVLAYATNLDARQRPAARRWLEDAFSEPAGIGFTWQTPAGFLRLSTLRGILPQPLPVNTVLGVVDEWLAHHIRTSSLPPTAMRRSSGAC